MAAEEEIVIGTKSGKYCCILYAIYYLIVYLMIDIKERYVESIGTELLTSHSY
jgi:hypothetical protein